MGNLLTIYEPFFLFATVMLVGFFAAKLGWVTPATQQAIGALMARVCIPAVVITVIVQAGRQMFFAQIGMLLVVFAVVFLLYLLSLPLARLAGLSGGKKEAFKALVMFGNTGYMGYPLVETLLGPARMLPVVIYSISDNLLVWTVGSYFITGGRQGGKLSPKRIINPIVVSILIGIVLALVNVPTDWFVFDAVFGVAGIARWLCMLWLGIELSHVSVAKALKSRCLYLYVAVKMILVPIGAYYALNALNILDADARFVITLILALPCMATLGIISQDTPEQEFVGSMIIGTLLFSFITVPFVLWVLGVQF